MSEEITVWKASDGSTFNSKIEADHHEIQLDIFNYISDNPIYTITNHITGNEFNKWLKDNPRIFIQLLPEENDDESGL